MGGKIIETMIRVISFAMYILNSSLINSLIASIISKEVDKLPEAFMTVFKKLRKDINHAFFSCINDEENEWDLFDLNVPVIMDSRRESLKSSSDFFTEL